MLKDVHHGTQGGKIEQCALGEFSKRRRKHSEEQLHVQAAVYKRKPVWFNAVHLFVVNSLWFIFNLK